MDQKNGFFKRLMNAVLSFLDEAWLIYGYAFLTVLFALSDRYPAAALTVVFWYLSSKLTNKAAKMEKSLKAVLVQIPVWIGQQIIAGLAIAALSPSMMVTGAIIICLNGPLLGLLQFFSWYNKQAKKLRVSIGFS